MQKSFIERIFPQSSSTLLPTSQREKYTTRISLPSTPSPITSRSSSTFAGSRHTSPQAIQSLQPTPLSASIVHHSDPLLPVDRAARALQKTIQSLLDAQSDGLSTGLGAGSRDDVSSTGSLTPTPSVATPPRSSMTLRTTPVRQPVVKKMSLRGARRGLVRSMQDFVKLKEEEIKVLDEQARGRHDALGKVQAFEEKRRALNAQIETIKHEGTSTSAEELQEEALQLDGEIKELEDKLSELKARQRHVLAQVSQIENSVNSKLSSYASSLEIVDREIKQFLKQPPVHSSLPAADTMGMGQSMYDLKPERRTLDIAKEQWHHEQQFLDDKKLDAEQEKTALEQGSMMWRETVDRINAFERDLRAASRSVGQSTRYTNDPEQDMQQLLPKLDETITFLENNLRHAETNSWNLIICCIGPELEAFQQGRSILRQTLGLPPLDSTPESEIEADAPDEDLMNGGTLRSPSVESNKSFEDTMKAFGELEPLKTEQKGKDIARDHPADVRGDRGFGFGFGPTKNDSESEEDDPGPDFLLSHS